MMTWEPQARKLVSFLHLSALWLLESALTACMGAQQFAYETGLSTVLARVFSRPARQRADYSSLYSNPFIHQSIEQLPTQGASS